MKTYRFKLYAHKRNRKIIKNIELSGKVYNHLIALHKKYYGLFKKYPSKYSVQKHITKLKRKPEYKHWADLNSQTLQNIAERIDFGYQKFFKKQNKRPPTFRKICKFKSFTLKQTGYSFKEDNVVVIQSVKYKYFKSREIEGNIKTVTIKRDGVGSIFLFVTTDVEEQFKNISATRKTAGFDFGLKTFLTGSDETEFQSPLFYKKSLSRRRVLSKELSRKRRGSSNRKRARIALAKTDIKIVDKRRDWMFKLARELCAQYSLISLETLSLREMISRWGRKVLDIAYAEFLKILKYVAVRFRTVIVFIDKWFPSTKLCSECGAVDDSLSLRDRTWKCTGCGALHNRDLNAAININREGASSLRKEGLRLRTEASPV